MTIEELITELQKIKDTHGNMEVRVTTGNPIVQHKGDDSQDTQTRCPFVFPSTITLDKHNFMVTDGIYEGYNTTYDNTMYLILGDFSIQRMNKSDIQDISVKYNVSRNGE